MFKRNGFYVDKRGFKSLNAFFRHLELGVFEISPNNVSYINPSVSLDIPFDNISNASKVNERSYKAYFYFFAITTLILLGAFVYYGPVNLENTLLFLTVLLIYVLIYYPTLYKRSWLKVDYKDGRKDKTAYFSFDWRTSYFLLPWGRQSGPFMWFINRGDCKQAAGLINKKRKK